ncbi:hypothetical protein L1887_35135 [Cichorium endivia]|nr:hypothetical protein L1887_35135 [Cichorium endivia]
MTDIIDSPYHCHISNLCALLLLVCSCCSWRESQDLSSVEVSTIVASNVPPHLTHSQNTLSNDGSNGGRGNINLRNNCQICHKDVHLASKCFLRFDNGGNRGRGRSNNGGGFHGNHGSFSGNRNFRGGNGNRGGRNNFNTDGYGYGSENASYGGHGASFPSRQLMNQSSFGLNNGHGIHEDSFAGGS